MPTKAGQFSVEVYLVGGAVRDELLGRAVHDRDWVVVGSNPEAMLTRGFLQVGKDFPVFLHPESKEEYALARTERKSGIGHQAFEFYAGADVSLEMDLLRRDLTINAIAKSPAGEYIDPFGGQADIEHKRLRHVSEAFAEDPLRIFRVARFAATLPGFEVVAETNDLMRRLAASSELNALSAERVWQEFHKALASPCLNRFVEVLASCQALTSWFAELDVRESFLQTTSQTNPLTNFAGIGVWLAPTDIAQLAERLKAPKRYSKLAQDVARYGHSLVYWRQQSAAEIFVMLEKTGLLRDANYRRLLLATLESLFKQGTVARLGEQVDGMVAEVSAEKVRAHAASELAGVALGQAIDAARVDYLAKLWD